MTDVVVKTLASVGEELIACFVDGGRILVKAMHERRLEGIPAEGCRELLGDHRLWVVDPARFHQRGGACDQLMIGAPGRTGFERCSESVDTYPGVLPDRALADNC
jgi:hypothetical protein